MTDCWIEGAATTIYQHFNARNIILRVSGVGDFLGKCKIAAYSILNAQFLSC